MNTQPITSDNDRAGILVLGIGNLLMGDEGLGVHFARRMEAEQLPAGVEVLDGGTAGFQLMSWLEGYEHIIMVDATLDERPAGAIREITPRFSSDFPRALSTHDIGLKDLVEGMYLLGRPFHITLFAVSIDEVQPLYVGLSPAIEAALPELVRRTRAKIAELQAVAIGL